MLDLGLKDQWRHCVVSLSTLNLLSTSSTHESAVAQW